MNHIMTEQVAANGIIVGFCLSCGFRHQDPLPTAEEVKKYYDDDQFYKSHAPSDWLNKERKEHAAGLWNVCYDYQLKLLDLNGSSSSIEYPSLVDVGCGAGWFIDRAWQKDHWGCYGIEPSRIARDAGWFDEAWPHRFGNIYRRYIGNILSSDEEFKQCKNVRLSLVLEHLVDPRAELMKWRNKLMQGGRILVITPNDFSLLQKKLGSYHFISKVHLNYFEPATLRNLMQSCGFRVIHESATFPLELFCLAGFDYRGNDKLGRKCHNARLQLEKVFGTRAFDMYKKLYDRYQWGRELIFIGQRV